DIPPTPANPRHIHAVFPDRGTFAGRRCKNPFLTPGEVDDLESYPNATATNLRRAESGNAARVNILDEPDHQRRFARSRAARNQNSWRGLRGEFIHTSGLSQR